jgi:5-methylcytosine-specific restriction endonuclease McrA
MPNGIACKNCGTTFDCTSSRKVCSDECKRELKRRYDRERYPQVRKETIARACDWQRENRERKRAYDAEYREKTRAHRLQLKREYGKRYYSENRERMQHYYSMAAHVRRSRVQQAGSFRVSRQDLRRCIERFGNRCAYCQSVFTADNRCEWDHVVPIARGGNHGIGNLVPACAPCNRSKSHRTVMEWRLRKTVARPSHGLPLAVDGERVAA